MKYDERACKFNMDTGCVELLLRDGRKNFHCQKLPLTCVTERRWAVFCTIGSETAGNYSL